MTTKRKILVAFLSLGIVALVAVVLLPAFASASNCGGNSYALTACKQIVIYARVATPTNISMLDLASLDASDQTNLFRIADSHWTAGAGYWVKTNNLGDTTQRQIIVVCDVAYDNVPQPTLWNFYRRNPAHAVGFSDGNTGLISPEEFTRMDRKGFVKLTALGKISQP